MCLGKWVGSQDLGHLCGHAADNCQNLQPSQPKPCCRSPVEIVWRCISACVWLCVAMDMYDCALCICVAALLQDCPYVCVCTWIPVFRCVPMCAYMRTATRCSICMSLCDCMPAHVVTVQVCEHTCVMSCVWGEVKQVGQVGAQYGQTPGVLQRVQLWLTWYFSVCR